MPTFPIDNLPVRMLLQLAEYGIVAESLGGDVTHVTIEADK
jgi:hypothetical protein